MPWDTIKLNDGNSIPQHWLWYLEDPKGHETTDEVDQAISVGFSHIDTAQIYRNEEETGKAIRESGLKREEIFITTKYSGMDMLDIETSIKDSLSKFSYIDLYLIHHPRIARPDIPTAWSEMEALKDAGLVKSIGVSNFGIKELKILLDKAKVKPAVNQIMLQPYVYAEQVPTIDFCKKHGIVVEGYSPLVPVTQLPNGPVTKPLKGAAKRLKATEDQVLLAWAKAKGAVILTSSSKKSRLEGYLAAGDLAISEDEIEAIDKAGAKGQRRHYIMTRVKSALPLVCAGVFAVALLNHSYSPCA